MVELLVVLLVVSVPVFYLYGVVVFLSKLFNKPSSQMEASSSSPQNQQTDSQVLNQLQQAAKMSPQMSIKDYLMSRHSIFVEQATQIDPAKPLITQPLNQQTSSNPLQEQNKPQILAQPDFDLNNWYKDNSINLLLYLGAFLIVAAVSLFISFQWQNFDSVTKFGVVLVFTLIWFVAAYLLSKREKFQHASVTFYTIGALLIPFVGVAWQRFMVGSFEQNFGFTWLMTSIISAGLYLFFIVYLKKRYFTYFAQLSMLSTSLAFVNLNQGPVEYYVMASVVTATLLLLLRFVWFKRGQKSNRIVQMDMEIVSGFMLIVSNLIGLSLLPQAEIPFFSSAVTVILALDSIYLWLFYSLRFEAVAFVFAELMSLATLAHMLKVFGIQPEMILYVLAGITGIIQLIQIQSRKLFKETTTQASTLGLTLVLSLLYLGSLTINYDAFQPVVLGLIFGLQTAWTAKVLKQDYWHLFTAASAFVVTWHLVLFTNLTETFQPLVFLLIGTILLLISLLPKMKMWLYYRAVALGGLTFNAAYYLLSIATVEVQTLNFPRHLTAATVALLTITLLSVYNLFTQNKLNKQADQAEASIKLLLSAVIYFAAFSHQWQWIPLLISILLVIQVWINAKLTKQVGFLYLGVFGLFMTLFHLHETSIGLPGSVYPILCIAVSVFVYSLAKVQLPWLETKFKDHWLHSGVIAGVLTALFSFISSQFDPAVGWTGYRLSSLMTGYISLILIWDYFGRFDLKHRQVATGFAAVLLYSWQVILLGRVYPTWNWLENRQFYTLPFGLYFLWSAYIGVKNQFNLDTVALLDWLGIGSLIGLTLLQNLGAASGNPYALLAGAYSIGFVFWGNYTQKKLYQQVGGVGVALSVLIQSSDFILNLPRWLLVGVVGLSLIGLALWLLNKRGEKK